jgi:anti-anti-sigma regulatory factor
MKRETKVFAAAVGLATIGACLKLPIGEHVACLLAPETPLRLKILSGSGDGTIALAYQLIPGELMYQYWQLRKRPTVEMFAQFALFIVLCGATHITNIMRFWWPLEYAFAVLKHVTGVVSLSVWWTLRKNRAVILALGEQDALRRASEEAALQEAAKARDAQVFAEGIARDLAVANEERAAQIELLEARDRTIRKLQTPIMEESPGRIVVPLIGEIDPPRAEEITHRLTAYAEARAPNTAILDLSGVDTVDTAVALALHRLVLTLGLQGVRCAATGVRGDVARTLVALGAERLGCPTYSTLAAGLAATASKA